MATNALDVVRRFLNAIETNTIDEIKQHLSGDFILRAGATQPLNKEQFLTVLVAMKQSFPALAVQILSQREDDQLAQSDRVAVDVQMTGTSVHSSSHFRPSQVEEESSTALPQGHLSFTLMGEIIESLIIADTQKGGLTHLFNQFRSRLDDRERADSLAHMDLENKDALKRYNKQSNLYDPQGKSYTPSQKDQDAAPQVDASSKGQQQPESAPYLFSDEQEQLKLTRRQPNKKREEQENHDGK